MDGRVWEILIVISADLKFKSGELMVSVANQIVNYDLQDGKSSSVIDESTNPRKSACTFCKKRKIKCNRSLPCSSCIKYNNPTCEFPQVSNRRLSKKRILEDELDMLKTKILRLEQGNNELNPTINLTDSPNLDIHKGTTSPSTKYDSSSDTSSKFYEFRTMELNFLMHESADGEFECFKDQETSTYINGRPRRAYGPLSWRGMCNFDPALKLHWDYYTHTITKTLNLRSKECVAELDKILARFRKYREKNVNLSESIRESSSFLKISLSPNQEEENEMLVKKIESILPPRKVIWALVDVFIKCFTFCHQIIIEEEFTKIISELIGGSHRDFTKPKLNYKSKIDLANAGIFLICLRFGYLTFLPTLLREHPSKPSDLLYMESDVKDYLSHYPVTSEFIELSDDCLSRFNLLDPCCFESFLLLVFSYMYKCFGPEHGVEPNNVEITNMRAFILQVAFSMGLNRNPTTKNGLITPMDRLGRHIWSQLVFDDVCNTLACGYPLLHTIYPYDEADFKFDPTIFPISTTGMTSSEMHKLKEAQLFMLFNQLNKKIQDIAKDFLMKLSDPNKSLKVGEVLYFLETLETELERSNGMLDYATINFEKVAALPSGFFQSFVLKMEIIFKFSTIPYYFKLFNYFEEMGEYELACYCLKKIVQNQLINLELFQEIGTNDEILSVLLIPQILGILHRNLLVNLSLNVRLQIINSNNELIKNTLDSISKNTQLHLGFVEKLLDKYYYAWYIKVIVVFGFASSEKTIEEIKSQELNFSLDFPMFRDEKFLLKVNQLYIQSNDSHMKILSKYKNPDDRSPDVPTPMTSASKQFSETTPSASSVPSTDYPNDGSSKLSAPSDPNDFNDFLSYMSTFNSNDFLDEKVVDELLRDIDFDFR